MCTLLNTVPSHTYTYIDTFIPTYQYHHTNHCVIGIPLIRCIYHQYQSDLERLKIHIPLILWSQPFHPLSLYIITYISYLSPQTYILLILLYLYLSRHHPYPYTLLILIHIPLSLTLPVSLSTRKFVFLLSKFHSFIYLDTKLILLSLFPPYSHPP